MDLYMVKSIYGCGGVNWDLGLAVAAKLSGEVG